MENNAFIKLNTNYMFKDTSYLGSKMRHVTFSKRKKRCSFRLMEHNKTFNRPFYRYGGHIELIRFKEYYRMPRGSEHNSSVFSSAFRDIFS